MRILFVGDLNTYARAFMRYRTLVRMGNEVDAISTSPVSSVAGKGMSSLPERILWKIGFPPDYTHANTKIRDAVLAREYDVVFIEKGNTIYPSTLRYIKNKLPQAKLISLSEDDMYAFHNRSWYYTLGLKEYRVVFTTKTFNLDELKRLGAKRTELFLDAYDDTLHRPFELSPEDHGRLQSDVCFVGTYERARAEAMLFLAKNGIHVVIWGNGWGAWRDRHQNLIVRNEPLLGEDYVKAVNAAKIMLCFLRKLNRDEVTNRSAEIPACGAFMLAERTERHRQMFKEDVEAVYFSSNEELLEKVRYYLTHSNERRAIAAAGRKRCEASGYSMSVQLGSILDRVA